jgi:hypothetical protein
MIEAEQMIDRFPNKKVVINNRKGMYEFLKQLV